MEYLYLSICILAGSVQSAIKKVLNPRCGEKTEFSVTALICAGSLLVFLLTTKNLSFVPAILPYAICFAICFATAAVTCVLALNTGSMGLTELMLAYSTILPLLYGIIFRGDPLTFWKLLGILLLMLSFVFTYCQPKAEKLPTRKSWVIFVVLLFLSNGFCSVIQRMQQVHFSGAQDGNFMVTSLILVVVMLLAAAFVRKERVLHALRKSTSSLGSSSQSKFSHLYSKYSLRIG